MSGNHFRIECSCGAVLAQCRCPSPTKRVEVRASACPKCRSAALPAGAAPIVAVDREAAAHLYERTTAEGVLAVERLKP